MTYKQLTDAEVLAEVKTLIAAQKLAWTTHSEARAAERGFDKAQIKECLMKGRFTERPTMTNRTGDVEYKFRIDAIVDSEKIAVAACLIPSKKVLVITVINV
jgi:hypothetical protein